MQFVEWPSAWLISVPFRYVEEKLSCGKGGVRDAESHTEHLARFCRAERQSSALLRH